MADDKKAQSRNTGPEPVQAEPNTYREKTYEPPQQSGKAADEEQKLPEKKAEDKVEQEMPEAVEGVKKRL